MIREFLIEQLNSTMKTITRSCKVEPGTVSEVLPGDYYTKRLFPEWEGGHNFFGKWSRLRILYHLFFYENYIALPAMKIWINKTPTDDKKIPNEEDSWDDSFNLNDLMVNFVNIRQEQVELLRKFSDDALDKIEKTIWGEKTLEWVIMKTIQHSFEHGNKMLRHVLFGPTQHQKAIDMANQMIKQEKEIDMEVLRELQDLES